MYTKDQLLELLSRPPSTNGLHVWEATSRCPERARLNAACPKVVGSEQSLKFDVGTLFHELAERYHMGADAESIMPRSVGDVGIDLALSEAWRLFDWYKTIYPVDAFGDALFMELALEDPAHNIGGRIDLVTRMTEDQALRARKRDGVLWQPGINVIDFKTHAAGNANQVLEDAHGRQAIIYPYLVQEACEAGAIDLAGPVQNFAYVHIIRHADLSMEIKPGGKKKFKSSMVTLNPYPSKKLIAAMLNCVDTIQAKAHNERERFNLLECATHDGLCPHLLSGQCTRGVI